MFKKTSDSDKQFCAKQRSCPGRVAWSKKGRFLRNSSAPGSEAARDKCLVQKNMISEKKVLPPAAKLSGTSGLFKKNEENSDPGSEAARDKWFVQKKSDFWEKVLPQAAKLPPTSGSLRKNRISGKKFYPGQGFGREKANNRCSQGRGAPSPPGKAGGCGGGAAPPPPAPQF